jgi:hypothetical protein
MDRHQQHGQCDYYTFFVTVASLRWVALHGSAPPYQARTPIQGVLSLMIRLHPVRHRCVLQYANFKRPRHTCLASGAAASSSMVVSQARDSSAEAITCTATNLFKTRTPEMPIQCPSCTWNDNS